MAEGEGGEQTMNVQCVREIALELRLVAKQPQFLRVVVVAGGDHGGLVVAGEPAVADLAVHVYPSSSAIWRLTVAGS